MPVNLFEMTAPWHLEHSKQLSFVSWNDESFVLLMAFFGPTLNWCAYVANKVSIRQKHDTYIIGICSTDEAVDV